MRFIFDFNLMSEGWSKTNHVRYLEDKGIDVTKTFWVKLAPGSEKGKSVFQTENARHKILTYESYFRPFAPTKKLSEWM